MRSSIKFIINIYDTIDWSKRTVLNSLIFQIFRYSSTSTEMLPAPPGYLAVRGRILSIPGTEYVVITPDWGTGDQEHVADVAQTQDTNSNSVVKIGNEDVKDQHHTAQATSNSNSVVKLDNEDVKDPQDTTKLTSSDGNVDDVALAGSPSANVQESIDTADTLPLLPKRSRGRPPKGRSLSPCQCPNCKVCKIQTRHATGDFIYRDSSHLIAD